MRMWMAKTAQLAPYYGIAFTRKDLKRDLTMRGITYQQKLKFVRVRIEEETWQSKHDGAAASAK